MAIEFLHSLDVAGDLQVDGAIKDSNGTDKSSNWNDAYSWGDHSLAGYLTSASNYYLSGVSFDTGNGKLTLTVNGATNQTIDLDGRWLTKTHQGGDDYFAGHHSEGRLIANAYLSNDLANLRLRGGALTATNTTFTDTEIDRMFDGTASIAGIPTTDFAKGPVVIEITIPRVLRYGAYVGIGFGNTTWRCKKVKIEAQSNGAWVTCTDLTNNAYEDVYTNIPGNSSGGTDKFRITLDDPNNNVRVCHIWAYNYDSRLWSETMMAKAGGTMYGSLTINGTLNSHTIPSGTGTLALTSDIPSKAADSDKLDGIDSTGFVKQLGDGSTPDYQTPTSRRVNPNAKNPTNEHYAISTFGNGGNVTGQLATHFQTGNLYSRGYNNVWSDWRRYHNSLDFSTTDVANGVTAYGWGDHSKAGYGSSTFDGKYSSLTGIPTTFAPSAHNHDTVYLKLASKAADSEKLDGIDSSRVIYGDNVTGTTSITGAAFNPSGHLKSGFYRVSKNSSTIPNATSVNFALHTSYNGDGNTAGFDIAVNDSTTSQIYFRPATGGGRGNWQTFFTTGNFTDNSTNWDAAYKWGDHSLAGYGTSSFDGKYSSLSGIPATFAPSSHNHDTRYVRSDVDDEATGKINFSYGTADFNTINGGLGVTPFKGTFQAANRPGSGNYATGLEFTYHDNKARTQFAAASSGNNESGELWVRSEKWGTTKVWTDWWKILHTGNSNTSNWDTAYGWGDHGSAGYLTALPTHNHDGRYLKLNARLKANADTINESGIHIWDVSESTDKPSGASDGLLTTKYWDSSSWAVQMYEDFHQREIHIRNKRNGTWQSDWAQVHTTDNFSTSDVSKGVTAHGWGNHASAGYSKTDTIFNGGDIDNPVIVANRSADSILHYAQSGNWTGAIKITLPGTHTSNWSMLVLRITVYEYKSEAHTTFTVSGHDWTSGWYNKAIKKWGNSSKNIDFGYSTSANTDCLIVGEVDSTWSYGHVTVDVVAHPSFYSSSMNIDSGWKIEKVTSLSGITRSNATNEQVHDSGDFSTSDVSKGVTAHGWGNHADAKYLTSYSETSDLENVRARDNSISGAINFLPDTGAILQVDGQTIIDRQTLNGAITIGHDDSIILAGGDTSGTLNSNINNAEETVFIGAEGGLKVYAFPDNMSGGWAARKEWRFQNDGDTDFPGKLYPSGGSMHYVDSTRIANWQTAYLWGNHASAGYITRSAPNAPVVSSKIVSDTIEVSITASTTGNIDQYLVFSSVVGSDFGLISVIPPEDFSSTMSVIDSSFAKTGKIEYRVYAVKQGVYSSAATTSQTYSAGTVEPLNLSVVPMNEAFYIQWDAPSTNSRFVEKYEVYHDSHDVEASINRNNATLIYSGNRLSHMVGSSDSKFNKFWVEIDVA